MNKLRLSLIIWVNLLGFVISPLCVAGMEPPLSSKIRAAYWNIPVIEREFEEQFRLLQEHGVNTALVADGQYHLRVNLWRELGRIAGRHALQLFPVLRFAVPPELKGNYLPYTNRYGTIYPATPCPLDGNYWNAVIGQRFEQIAALSKVTSIAGILFDTEMYGSDISVYADPCFCDACWQKFVQAYQNMDDLPKEQRFAYLRQHRLLQSYSDFQDQQLQAILSQFEQQVHAINARLVLGFLGYRPNWFYTGVIRGLGTISNPVMVFSESSYVRGYTPYVTEEKRTIAAVAGAAPPITQYIPGVWLARFFPEELPSQLVTLARDTDGYWIYTADSLWTTDQQTGEDALHGSNEAYWRALKQTNEELQRLFPQNSPLLGGVRGGFENQSIIAPVSQYASFYDVVHNRLMTQPSLKQFLRTIFGVSARRSPEFSKLQESTSHQALSEMIYRGEILFHCLKEPVLSPVLSLSKGLPKDEVQGNQVEGTTGTITITHLPVGKYEDYTAYKLFDENGMVFQKGFVDRHTCSTTIRLPARISGVVSLLIDSGSDAARVSFTGLPFVIEASNTFPLTIRTPGQMYTFFVKPEADRIKLRAYCSKATAAALTVRSPDNKIHQEVGLVGFTEIALPLGNDVQDGQNLWTMTIDAVPSKPYEEVQCYLSDEEFPYLIGDHAVVCPDP